MVVVQVMNCHGVLERVAEAITSGQCRRILFLTGAGVSVAAGIPDFRSPGGMYDTLRPDLLTASEREKTWMKADPTAVVSQEIFYENPFPYLEVRRPFILGTAETKWKPTLAHWFMRLCYDHGLLLHVYTQNIDGLDYKVGLPEDKITAVHGSMAVVQCEFCGETYPLDDFYHQVKTKIRDIYGTNDPDSPSTSTEILCQHCHRPGVKPNTVLYGSRLPKEFNFMPQVAHKADLLIIAGTSLTVSPANSVVYHVPPTCPRLIINREPVGADLGINYRQNNPNAPDMFVRSDSDDAFLDLISHLHWRDEMDQYIR